jgi:hypothetical protein
MFREVSWDKILLTSMVTPIPSLRNKLLPFTYQRPWSDRKISNKRLPMQTVLYEYVSFKPISVSLTCFMGYQNSMRIL